MYDILYAENMYKFAMEMQLDKFVFEFNYLRIFWQR